MSRDYGALRLWSRVLIFVGLASVMLVAIGVIIAAVEADSFWQILMILLIGGPLTAFFASWPIALGQALEALADIAETVRDRQGSTPQRLSEGERVPID